MKCWEVSHQLYDKIISRTRSTDLKGNSEVDEVWIEMLGSGTEDVYSGINGHTYIIILYYIHTITSRWMCEVTKWLEWIG